MKLFCKITGIVAVLGALLTSQMLESSSLIPYVIIAICCAYIVFLFIVRWNDFKDWHDDVDELLRRQSKCGKY